MSFCGKTLEVMMIMVDGGVTEEASFINTDALS
jgi:hypothetical protein